MTGQQVRIITTTIDVPLAAAYGFAQHPENFSRWAAGLSRALRRTDAGWLAETPLGEALVRFSGPNAYGVLDHWVEIEGRPVVYVPLRMIASGNATLVELVLFRQPAMSDADFEHDAGLVRNDLATLKTLLEHMP